MKHFKINFNITVCLLAFSLSIQSCNQEPDYKTVRQEVLDQHDKLMIDGEQVMALQRKLDTLSKSGLKALKKAQPALDTLSEQQQIKSLSTALSTADDSMNNWMHSFNPDAEGKSNHDAVLYFKSEKVKVNQIDSLYQKAFTNTNLYLTRFNMHQDSSATSAHKHEM